MALSPDVAFDIASASICAVLILVRCGYRIMARCKSHEFCHRTWHVDDAYMAFALIPLFGRTFCISWSFILNPHHQHIAATQEEATRQGITLQRLEDNLILSYKLLIPGRLGYALFLWSLKLCLLTLYARFVHVLHRGQLATKILWWFIVVSFFGVAIPTIFECNPIDHFWALETHKCQRSISNLIAMAVFNIITDLALVIFPFPILRYVTLDKKAKIPLILLFLLAGLVIGITIVRLPLILNESLSQKSRSMWASIEILCACIVANTAFFYSLLKEFQRGHDSRAPNSSNVPQNSFYLQSIPSVSGRTPPGGNSHSYPESAARSMSISAQSVKPLTKESDSTYFDSRT